MITLIVLSALYCLGYVLCFCMLRIEHEAQKLLYTKGARIANIFYSLLSWAMVLFILISAWFQKIKAHGYFDEPVKPESK